MNFITLNPEWVSAGAAVVAVSLAVYEYYFRRRPYLKVDVEIKKIDGKFLIYGNIVNFGSTPSYFWIPKEDVCIKIGDEKFIGSDEVKAYAFPNEKNTPYFEIGTINPEGINKLLNKKYTDNSSSISIKMRYRSFRFKWVKYEFNFIYELQIHGTLENPSIKVFVKDQKFS